MQLTYSRYWYYILNVKPLHLSHWAVVYK